MLAGSPRRSPSLVSPPPHICKCNLAGGAELNGLTERHQHGHRDDEESDESVENLDGQLERAALLTPHAPAPAATWSTIRGRNT